MRAKSLLATAILCVSAMLFTACQSVGGVDLNRAITEPRTSAEASAHLSWELLTDSELLAESKSKDKIELLRTGEFDFANIKASDDKSASVDGSFTLHGHKVPFNFFQNEDETVIKFGGMKKYIKDSGGLSSLNGLGSLRYYLPFSVLRRYQDMSEEDNSKLGKLLIKHFPNPKSLTIEKKTATINGESVELTNVTANISGPELPELTIQFIDSVLANDADLKEMLAIVNSSAKVDEAKKWLKQFKKDIVNEDVTLVDFFKKKANTIKITLGIDSNSAIRTIHSDVTIMVPRFMGLIGSQIPVTGVHTVLDVSLWNIGQTIKPNAVPEKAPIMGNEMNNSRTFLKSLDGDSELYKLLHDDFKIQNTSVRFYYQDHSGFEKHSFGDAFINRNGTMMIKARKFAERMGLNVGWDKETQSVTLEDGDHTLKIKEGETGAMFAGQPVTLSEAPIIHDGFMYVPLRSVTDLYGMKVTLNNEQKYLTFVEVNWQE